MEPALTPAGRARQLRGMAIHFGEHAEAIRRSREFRRALIAPFGYGGKTGTCRWCRRQCERRRKWHEECNWAYRTATGQSVTYLWRETPPCPCGNESKELDHQDALVLAWTSNDPKRMARAWTTNNLVWLCRDCHRKKTARDLNALSEMRGSQRCLIGLIPEMRGIPGKPHWVRAESGLATRVQYEEGSLTGTKDAMRRGPVTFRPEAATCPRCLVAMEFPHSFEDARKRLLGMPQGWHLDETQLRWERNHPGRGPSVIGDRLNNEERRALTIKAGQMVMEGLG